MYRVLSLGTGREVIVRLVKHKICPHPQTLLVNGIMTPILQIKNMPLLEAKSQGQYHVVGGWWGRDTASGALLLPLHSSQRLHK